MDLQSRITALAQLGNYIETLLDDPENEALTSLLRRSEANNPWFTPQNVFTALEGIALMLEEDSLETWLSVYTIPNTLSTKTLGAVLAGNIPMVGFHDMLCALVTGVRFKAKLSSKDKILLPFLLEALKDISPELASQVCFTDDFLKDFDLIIATGSDNSARYFNYYFNKYPNIIRKNRSSVAVLTGKETQEELDGLADDVFLYFGLGCRNVAKLYVPESFVPEQFFRSADKHGDLQQHNKYMNNYEYNRALYLMNSIEHFDNGFCILTQSESISSPITVVYYEKYSKISQVAKKLEQEKDSLQCIVSAQDIFHIPSTEFGDAQFPAVNDYADDIDTVQFILNNIK